MNILNHAPLLLPGLELYIVHPHPRKLRSWIPIYWSAIPKLASWMEYFAKNRQSLKWRTILHLRCIEWLYPTYCLKKTIVYISNIFLFYINPSTTWWWYEVLFGYACTYKSIAHNCRRSGAARFPIWKTRVQFPTEQCVKLLLCVNRYSMVGIFILIRTLCTLQTSMLPLVSCWITIIGDKLFSFWNWGKVRAQWIVCSSGRFPEITSKKG